MKPSVSYDVDFALQGVGSANKLLGPFNASSLPTSCLDYQAKSTSTGLVVAPSVNPGNGAGSVVAPMFGCLFAVAMVAVVMG